MLLPSVNICDPNACDKRAKPIRPKLPSFNHFEPLQRSLSPVQGLIASCRALQSMIGDCITSPSPLAEDTQERSIEQNPFDTIVIQRPTPAAPRGPCKRTRDDFEKENIGSSPRQPQPVQLSPIGGPPRTPKRRRRAPLQMPLGLRESDFETLTPKVALPVSYPPRQPEADLPMNADKFITDSTIGPENVGDWTLTDDRLLVETVLAKMSLSIRDWNDCASRLGRDKDSIGKRWSLLLGGGNVGLRRGIGSRDRVSLEVESW